MIRAAGRAIALAALLLAAGAGTALAQAGAHEPAVAIAAMPALKGVAVALQGASEPYAATVGQRRLAASVFGGHGAGGARFWVVGVPVDDGKKARDLVVVPGSGGPSGGALELLARLELVGIVLLISERDGEVAVKDLPPALRSRVDGGGVKLATVPLRAGVNVVASAKLAGAGVLEDVAKALGIPLNRVALTGRLPAAPLRVLAGEAAGPPGLDDTDVALALPGPRPAGLEAVLESSALTMGFKGDKGQVLAAGGATLRLHPPEGAAVDVPATLELDPAPADGKAFARLRGKAPVDRVIPKLPISTLKVESLELELAVVKQGDKRTPQARFHGRGKLGASPLDLTATLGKTADGKADVALALASSLKLADVLGHPVPGVGDAVMLERITLARDSIGGTVRLGTGTAAKDVSALVYTPAGKSKHNLAIGHPSLTLADLVPPVKTTALADLALANAAVVIVPEGNAATGLTATTLPPALVALLGGPQADALTRAGGLDLPAGVSVMASLDVANSKPLHALLDAVGVATTGRLPVGGRLDPDLLTHTPWGGKAGATSLGKSFLDHLDVSVPLPALALPGGAKALTLKPGALAVKGAGGVSIAIETAGDVALPDRTLTVTPLTLSLAKGSTTAVALAGTLAATSHGGGDVKQLVTFPGLTVASVTFAGQVDATRRLTAAIDAKGKLKLPGGEKTVELRVSLDSGDTKAGSVQVLTALTVNDFAGTPVPGIGSLQLRDLTLTPASFAGTVRFRNEDTTVVGWTPAGATGHRVALVHDKLKIASYVSGLRNTALDLELDGTALVYVPKGAAQKAVAAEQLPARLVDALGGKAAGVFPLDLAEGITVSTMVKLPSSGALHDLLGGLGLTQTVLPLRAVLDPAYLAAKAPAKGKAGRWPRFDVNVDLPAFHPPGAGGHVAFEKGHLTVKPSDKDKGSYEVALATQVAVTLDPSHVLRFTGAISREKSGVLSFLADAKVPLKAPFGIQWLTLDELEARGTIDRARKAVDLSVTGTTKIAGKPVTVVTKFIEDGGTLKDVVFALTGHLPLSVVPGLGALPGMSGLTVVDPEVSRTHVSGEIDFRKVTIRAAVFKDADDWNLLFENSHFRLDQLLPGLAAGHLKALSFPKTALLVSHKGFARKASELPPAITAILVDLGLKSDDTVSAMAGVNLVTTLDPHTLTGPLRTAMDRLGVQQPVVLAGAIGGLFGGTPSLSLEAILPKVPVPPMKFLKLHGKADLKLLLALTPSSLSVGIGTDAGLRVGHDDLIFDAAFNLVIEPTDVIVDITGKLRGDWHQPLGIKGLVLEGVFLAAGLDVTGAAKLTLGGKTLIGDDEIVVEAGTSLQLEAAGIPTGLGLVGQAAHLGLGDLVAAAEQLAHGAGAARHSSAGAPKEMASFKDVTVAFVTPGVVLDPTLLRGSNVTLPSEGIALGGTLLLGGKPIATVGGYAAPTGIKIGGSISPFDVGPMHLYKAAVDFQTAVGAKPHFLLKGHAKLLSADVELDVTLDEGGFAFTTKDKFGDGVEVELAARSTNGFSLKNNDFSVHAELTADVGRHIVDALRRALDALVKDLEADDKAEKAKLAEANKTVKDREQALAATRARVQRERSTAVHDVDAVRKKLRDLDHQLDDLPKQIARARKDAAAAVRNLRFARAAELRVQAAAWEVELAGARAAHKATDALLKAIESGVADIPVDADPRVLADLVALDAARVHAGVLDLEVKVLDLVVRDLEAAATRLTGADVLDIHRVLLDGTFGTQLRFTVDARIFGKYDVQAVGAFSPKDAASKAAGLFAAAKDLASHLLSHKRSEHEDATKPPPPPAATAAGPSGTAPAGGGATAPAGTAPAAPAGSASSTPAAAGPVDLGPDKLVGIGGDVDSVIYVIKKGP
jgi:hypothetical protein